MHGDINDVIIRSCITTRGRNHVQGINAYNTSMCLYGLWEIRVAELSANNSLGSEICPANTNFPGYEPGDEAVSLGTRL